MLNPDVSCFENSADQDQLASKNPAAQDTHCFLLCLKIYANYEKPMIEEECSTYKIQLVRPNKIISVFRVTGQKLLLG